MGRLRAGGRHITSLGMSTRIDESQWTPSHWRGGTLGVHHSRSPQCQMGPVRCHLALLHSHPASPPSHPLPLSESMWGRYRH